MATAGLITVASCYGPDETTNRLEAEIKARGLAIFARVDHAAGAERAGLALRPTEVLTFGNAQAGTPLMQANQTIGIDLPLRIRPGLPTGTGLAPRPTGPSPPWPRRSAASPEPRANNGDAMRPVAPNDSDLSFRMKMASRRSVSRSLVCRPPHLLSCM
jgi:hypothetical protein